MAPPAPTTSTTITVPSSMQHPLPTPQQQSTHALRTHKGRSMQHPHHSRPRRASPLAPAVHRTRLPQSAHSHNPTRQPKVSQHTTLHRTQQFLNTTPHTLSPQQQSTPKSVQRPHTPQDTIRTLIPHLESHPPYLGRVGRSEMVTSVVNDHSAMHVSKRTPLRSPHFLHGT